MLIKDVVYAEGGLPAMTPVTRVAACAVIANPLAGRAQDDLGELIPFGAELGELLVKEALALLPQPAISYGKAAIVGTSGDIEHAAAILHPRMGKPMRDAIGGGQAIIPSNVKIGAVGCEHRRSARPQGRRLVVRSDRHAQRHGSQCAASRRDRGDRGAGRWRPAAAACREIRRRAAHRRLMI